MFLSVDPFFSLSSTDVINELSSITNYCMPLTRFIKAKYYGNHIFLACLGYDFYHFFVVFPIFTAIAYLWIYWQTNRLLTLSLLAGKKLFYNFGQLRLNHFRHFHILRHDRLANLCSLRFVVVARCFG